MAWDIYGYDSPTHYHTGLSATIGETLLTRRYSPCPLVPPGDQRILLTNGYNARERPGDVSLCLNARKVFFLRSLCVYLCYLPPVPYFSFFLSAVPGICRTDEAGLHLRECNKEHTEGRRRERKSLLRDNLRRYVHRLAIKRDLGKVLFPSGKERQRQRRRD